MSDERYSPDRWQEMYRPIKNWDEMFARGDWTYLGSIEEAPRFAMIAGYIHQLVAHGVVLDAGCGEGHLVGYLDQSRIAYRGFDLSKTAIANARAKYPGTFVESTLESFASHEDEKYDAVVFNEVLPHVAAPFEIIDRFASMLKPNGHIIISTFQSPNEASNARLFTGVLTAEIAAGRYRQIASAEVSNIATGLRWCVTVLG